MQAIIDYLNTLLWGHVLIYALLAIGCFFTLRLGVIQLRHFGHMFTIMSTSRGTDKHGISSFQALCTTLASRVGVGNLTGVALALYAGGPGAIFWMWVTALLGMATAFAESTLAQLFKVKDRRNSFRGGPAYYIQYGLGRPWMGKLFAVSLLFSFGLAFNAVQMNSISEAFYRAFAIPHWQSAVFVVLFTGVVIFGGFRQVARVAEWTVPFMALTYLLMALVVIVLHADMLWSVLVLVVKSAFGWQQAAGGAFGYACSQAMLQGIKRGLYSNEAGLGSAPNAAASAAVYPLHPVTQGYVQMLGPFVDTLLICTATAAIILLSGPLQQGVGANGIALTQQALSIHIGQWGSPFLALAVLLFAFTTIIGNYAYAESNLVFLRLDKTRILLLLRLLFLASIAFGAFSTLPLVWALADLSMGCMAAINLVAIVLLSRYVVVVTRDYHAQRRAGKVPLFNARQYPWIQQKLPGMLWEQEL